MEETAQRVIVITGVVVVVVLVVVMAIIIVVSQRGAKEKEAEGVAPKTAAPSPVEDNAAQAKQAAVVASILKDATVRASSEATRQQSIEQAKGLATTVSNALPDLVVGLQAQLAQLKKELYQAYEKRPAKTRFLAYVDAGDDVLAPVTPGFTAAAKAFFERMQTRLCWKAADATIFYANDYDSQPLLKKYLWYVNIASFFSKLAPGDTLIFFLLTHGGINDQGVEFILGGLDEDNMTAVAQRLPAGVRVVIYNAGCEQESPVRLAHHRTVTAAGRATNHPSAETPANARAFKADVVTITDTWNGYLSQFESPAFAVPSFPGGEQQAYTAVMLNYLYLQPPVKPGAPPVTFADFLTAYASWHPLRGDEAKPGMTQEVVDNIVAGRWTMFRPVVGVSRPELWDAPMPALLCS